MAKQKREQQESKTAPKKRGRPKKGEIREKIKKPPKKSQENYVDPRTILPTPEIIEKMLKSIRLGNSLTKTCNKIIHISLTTVYQWLKNNDELALEYARACEDRADTKNDKISEIIDKIEAGLIDPNAARVMIDAIKWQAAHERPKRYGDRIDVDHGGKLVIERRVIGGDADTDKRVESPEKKRDHQS